jgi:hypothetical protein
MAGQRCEHVDLDRLAITIDDHPDCGDARNALKFVLQRPQVSQTIDVSHMATVLMGRAQTRDRPQLSLYS